MVKTYGLGLVVCVMSALVCPGCKNESEADQARERVAQARTLVEEGNLEAAKLQLDSVHILYRQQVDVRREAKALQDTITLLEAERTAAYADSMLQVLLPQRLAQLPLPCLLLSQFLSRRSEPGIPPVS